MTEVRNKLKDDVPKSTIMNHMFLITSARINQPQFSSQTKEELTTRIPASVSMCDSSIGPKLQRSGFISFLKAQSSSANAVRAEKAIIQQLKASTGTTGSRRNDVQGVEHYEGAELAGRAVVGGCYLFLTEGLSAQNCARNVIARLPGDTRRRCGSYALRGKLINAMSNPMTKVWANKEVQSLVKICNLNPSLAYKDTNERRTLRYSRLILWTDADTDGGHIAWLVFLLIYKAWPHLARSGYLERFVTPLLKIQLSPTAPLLQFYSEAARDRWLVEQTGGERAEMAGTFEEEEESTRLRRQMDALVMSKGARVKYFKGLGRLMAEDERDLATRFETLRIQILCSDEDLALVEAIGGEDSEQRRVVQNTRTIAALPYEDLDSVSVHQFVDGELLPYMRDANLRQIPGIDGFIEVTRMIMAYFFVKPSAADPKAEHGVARLAAAIAAELDYHHGESSMAGAIATMAQDFAGKNNVNLLQPRGQFGTRAEPTPAAPRYTNTALATYAHALFPREDYPALPMPRHGDVPTFIPGIIPMVLINGASGIGYGHSTSIPSHHPDAVIEACLDWIRGTPAALRPWVRGLTTQPVWNSSTERWESRGKAELNLETRKLIITELPVGTWTKHYASWLESKVPWVSGVFMHPKIASVLIEADVEPSAVPDGGLESEEALLKALRLVEPIPMTNMKCFDHRGRLRQFSSVHEILADFAELRMWVYSRRKRIQQEKLSRQIALASNMVKFIQLQLDGVLDLRAMEGPEDVHEFNRTHGVEEIDNSYAYLDSLKMMDVTRAKVQKFKADVEALQIQKRELDSKDERTMWKEELLAARKIFSDWGKEQFAEAAEGAAGASSAGGSSGTQTRKRTRG
jgi:DNA topoisomerase-2